MKEAVGIVIIAKKTNRFLLLHRASSPIVWSVLSGKMDPGETNPYETVKREIWEEIRINPNTIKGIRKVGSEIFKKKLFHVFVGFVEEEFEIPNLKLDENDDYGWFTENSLPKPLHKRWEKTFQLIKPILELRESFNKNFNNLMDD